MKYDLAIYIGRFEPFHNGHKYAVTKSLELAENVLILVGSSDIPRNPKNPFTSQERIEMIRRTFPDQTTNQYDLPTINIFSLVDHPYNDQKWAAEVQRVVGNIERASGRELRIVLVGHHKDESSYYLKMFPQWHFQDLGFMQAEVDGKCMDATRIRELYYNKEYEFIRGVVPQAVYDYMMSFTLSPEYATLRMEQDFINKYKKSWAAAPYAPTFVTADAVVVQSGHVLLVQRKAAPGEGLWALPGGFVNQNERIQDAAVRELIEETCIDIPELVLRRAITYNQVFDAPGRSLRGRTITHAYLFKLDDTKPLPRIKGSDDAINAKWVSLNDVKRMRPQLFEDHFDIIETMIDKL